MDERAAGIILRTRPLTETSLIVHWLTPGLGRLSTVAKGARRPKSPLRGKLDLFFEAEFSFARSRRSDLHTLREVSLREMNEPLRRDLAKLQQAAYAVGLIEQTTEMESPVPEIFLLVKNFIAHLRISAPQPLNIFALEMKLLAAQGLNPNSEIERHWVVVGQASSLSSGRHLLKKTERIADGEKGQAGCTVPLLGRSAVSDRGLKPDLAETKLSAGARMILAKIQADDFPSLVRLKISEAQARELRQFLHGFLIYHLGRLPKGREAALTAS